MYYRITLTTNSLLTNAMVYHDPYTPERKYYECRDCGYRTTGTDKPGSCPECDGLVKNIAVPQE
ncbi:rubrerythrin-like domain-containing protein [Halomontanus rarus]|uniref:rubrerythrin-like domain-containing protein n=1 Tax=Halomontanus rarus TaxID=3034020 RepID=UPI002FFCA54C